MANDLAPSEPLFFRMLRALGLAGVREETGESVHIAGADFASGNPASSGYPAVNSLSTVAVFPYVKAACDAGANDLASLPLRVAVGKGADSQPVDDHPVLSLLERPSSRISGDHLRRQVTSDLILCGDAYVLCSGRTEPEILLRLHPSRVKIVPMSDGQVSHFEYSGSGLRETYEWDQVLHFRMTSWEDDPSGLYGNGAIRALASDLTADRLASQLAAESAKTGRPTTVFSPSDPADTWTDSQLATMRRVFEAQMKGTGGALFLGGSATMTPLSFSPRDLEYQELRKGVYERVLAVFDCPPTRLGGSSVNFATAAEQSKHWWSGLRSKAAILDGQLTRLARKFPGWEDSDVRVYHDFSGIDALSESRDARVNRVLTWNTLGVELNDAAAYEGFDDLPGIETEEAEEGAVVEVASTDQPMAATALNGAQVASLISILGQVSAGLLNADAAVALIGAAFPTVSEPQARRIVDGANAAPAEPETKSSPSAVTRQAFSEDEQRNREEVWRSFIERVHDPETKKLEQILKKYLRAAGARAAKRAADEIKKAGPTGVTKQNPIDDAALDRILDALTEAKILKKAVYVPMREIFEGAVQEALDSMPPQWSASMSPARIDEAVNAQIGELVRDVQPTTADAVREVVIEGVEEGQTIGEMQRAIMNSRAYSPSRALRIASTEVTRSVNGGAVAAYTEIADAGFPVRYSWLSAKDRHVRDDHRKLDNHPPIAPGEKFKVDGLETAAPGGFGVASQDINCRCTVIPSFDDEE